MQGCKLGVSYTLHPFEEHYYGHFSIKISLTESINLLLKSLLLVDSFAAAELSNQEGPSWKS